MRTHLSVASTSHLVSACIMWTTACSIRPHSVACGVSQGRGSDDAGRLYEFDSTSQLFRRTYILQRNAASRSPAAPRSTSLTLCANCFSRRVLQRTDRILRLNRTDNQFPETCPQLRTDRIRGTSGVFCAKTLGYKRPEQSTTGRSL